MSGGWADSTRRLRLPPGWDTIRRQVLNRDGWACTWIDDGRRCGQPANHVDHINRGDDHTLTNLRALCEPHHNRKSSAEGNTARRRLTNRRPPERHPGLL